MFTYVTGLVVRVIGILAAFATGDTTLANAAMYAAEAIEDDGE